MSECAELTPLDKGLTLTWRDGSSTSYSFIWLRDNDPAELHPHTHERTFDLGSICLDITPSDVRLVDDTLTLQWPDRADCSSYSLTWLRAHQPGTKRADPSVVEPHTWDGSSLSTPPTFSAPQCSADRATLMAALHELKRTGIILIDDLADEALAGERFGDIIGFKRETNFGVMFEVINRPEPNNLAYTALALPLHTDLPNQAVIPGYQFLHCYQNSASGGASVFADGFQICAALKARHPEAYEVLTHTEIPFRFHDADYDIRTRRCLIETNAKGQVTNFAFNAHIADVADLPYAEMLEFYAAYQTLLLLMREPQFALHVQLQPGQMVAFDNGRVLHGRTAFDAHNSTRYLRGYYIEKNEVDSRMRVLAR